VCFEQAKKYFKKYLCVVSPYPTRYSENDKITQQEALKKINFTADRFTLFIIGGSQGASSLSMLIQKLIAQHADLKHHIQCIHQTGSDDKTNWHSWYQEHNIPAIVFDYQHELAPCFCAGAGGIFEINFFNKPCILVPLQTAQTSHQVDNAQAYAHEHPKTCLTSTQEQEIIRELIHRIKTK
jgi:UDP-N-acetylglucosamine:LPS N-acetylglucosamine transferase